MELQQALEMIEKYIRPQCFPVAIRMLEPNEKAPVKAKQPKQDLGTPMPVCQAVALARRYGWVLSMEQEDMLCPLGSLTLGFVPAKKKFLEGKFNIPFWVKDEVRAKMTQNLSRLEYGKYKRIIISPAQKVAFDPQVIIFYGNPSQLSRFVQGWIYSTGEPVISSSAGGFACGAEITQPLLTGKCQLVITGGGDRAIAQAHDHEAAFAVPAAHIETIARGLEATHQAGMRYPTTSFLLYKAQFPPAFAEMMQYLESQEE